MAARPGKLAPFDDTETHSMKVGCQNRIDENEKDGGWALVLFQKIQPFARPITAVLCILGFILLPIFYAIDRDTVIEEHSFTETTALTTFPSIPLKPKLTGQIARQLRLSVAGGISHSHNNTDTNQMHISPYALTLLAALSNELGDDSSFIHQFNIDGGGYLVSHNVVAIAQGGRADPRDCFLVVFAADWQKALDAELSALGVSLARHLKDVQWMSRDVIMLFVDKNLPFAAGVREFMKDYINGAESIIGRKYRSFNETDNSLTMGMYWVPDVSLIRRGIIRMGMCVEFGEDSYDDITEVLLDVEGVDGLLPNQDLVNVFASEARREQINCVVRQVWDSVIRHATNDAAESTHTVLLQLGIPAFRALGVSKQKSKLYKYFGHRKRPIGLSRWIRSLEGVTRSQSNVLQTLHHSFNFYFFTSPSSHASSGTYMYFAFPLVLPLAIWPMTSKSPNATNGFARGCLVVVGVLSMATLPSFVFSTNRSVLMETAKNVIASSVSPVWYSVPKVSLVPECGALVTQGESLYRVRVVLWILFAAVCYTLTAAIIVLFVARKRDFDTPTKSKKPSVESVESSELSGCSSSPKTAVTEDGEETEQPLWKSILSAGQTAMFLFLIGFAFVNWSLTVCLAVIFVPPYIFAFPIRQIAAKLQTKARRWSAFRMVVLVLWFLALGSFCCPFQTPLKALRQPTGEAIAAVASTTLRTYRTFLKRSTPKSVEKFLPIDFLDFWASSQSSVLFAGNANFINPSTGANETQEFLELFAQTSDRSARDLAGLPITSGLKILPISKATADALKKSTETFVLWLADRMDSKVTFCLYRMAQRHECMGDWLFVCMVFGVVPAVFLLVLVVFFL